MKNVIQGTTLSGTGAVSIAPGAEITIRNPSGQLVPLWADRAGTQPHDNPFLTDNEGNFRVYADSGWVHVRAQKDGSVREWRYVPLGSAAAMDIGEVYEALGAEVYSSVSEGLSNSAEGDFFLVESSGSLDLYRVVNGVAEQRAAGIGDNAILATRAYADGVAAEAESNATNTAVAAASAAYQQATEYSDSQLQTHRESGDHDGRYYTKTEVDQALDEKVDEGDPRLSNAREWTAEVVSQSEAEAGTSSVPRKWTAERVRQAIEALGGGATRNVATLADLRALSGGQLTGSVFLRGRTAPGDGGAGTFVWLSGDQSANVAADPLAGIYVAPDSDPSGANGAWRRLYRGAVSVVWFGAVGDGVTDDSAAFGAAASYAQTAGGSAAVITIPSGSYVLDAVTLTGSKPFVIRGDGLPILTHKAGASDAMLTFGTGTTVDVYGIVFDGNAASQPEERDLLKFSAGGVTQARIHGCQFREASGRGIGGNCHRLFVTGSVFTNCRSYPCQTTGDDLLEFVGNTVAFDAALNPVSEYVRAVQPNNYQRVVLAHNPAIESSRKYRDGFWIRDCANVTITGNVIAEHFDDSITLVGTTRVVTITGNILRGSDVTGGVVFVSGSTAEDVTISGNTFEDGMVALYLFAGKRVTITGNTVRNYRDGIVFPLAQPSSTVVVADNTFTGITQFGIDCGASNDLIIRGNQFVGDGGEVGIMGRRASGVVVESNAFSGFTTHVQTGDSDWTVSNNKIGATTGRGISVGDQDGTVGLSINGNVFEDCLEPVTVVSGKGSGRFTITGNRIDHTTDYRAVPGRFAIELADAHHVAITGNSVRNYRVAVSSAAGSDYGVYTGNDESLCGMATALDSMTNKTVIGNLTP